MSQGRGSAFMNKVTLISLLCLLVMAERINAATYTVGGTGGWTYNTDTWPSGKNFRVGDVLIFNYDSTTHNVVAVDKSGYNNCKTPGRAKVFSSGSDQIKLTRGQNYFICSYPGHCQSGMKITVNAV